MIVVDASVIAALILNTSEAAELIEAIDMTPEVVISAVARVDAVATLHMLRPDIAPERIASFIDALNIETVPPTPEQTDLAIRAYAAYGEGQHDAALTLSGCFTYALARSNDAQVLDASGKFAQTDLAAPEEG